MQYRFLYFYLLKLGNNIKKNLKTTKNRNLVTGGAGFLGSHLIDKLMESGEDVICLDNYFTGRKSNIFKWINNPNFELIRHDVTNKINLEVDNIWHSQHFHL